MSDVRGRGPGRSAQGGLEGEPWLVMALPPGGFLTIGVIRPALNALGRRGSGPRAVRTMWNPVAVEEGTT